jgi:hypothetical protein
VQITHASPLVISCSSSSFSRLNNQSPAQQMTITWRFVSTFVALCALALPRAAAQFSWCTNVRMVTVTQSGGGCAFLGTQCLAVTANKCNLNAWCSNWDTGNWDASNPYQSPIEYYVQAAGGSGTTKTDAATTCTSVGGALLTYDNYAKYVYNTMYLNGCGYIANTFSSTTLASVTGAQPDAKRTYSCATSSNSLYCGVEYTADGWWCGSYYTAGVCQATSLSMLANTVACERPGDLRFMDDDADTNEFMFVPAAMKKDRADAFCTKFASSRGSTRWPAAVIPRIWAAYNASGYSTIGANPRSIQSWSGADMYTFSTAGVLPSTKSFTSTNTYLPFVCTRAKLSWTIDYCSDYSDQVITNNYCFGGRTCKVRLNLGTALAKTHIKTGTQLTGPMWINGTMYAAPVIIGNPAVSLGSTTAGTINFAAPRISTPSASLVVTWDPAEGNGWKRNITKSLAVTPLWTVVISGSGVGPSSTVNVYPGQTLTLSATRAGAYSSAVAANKFDPNSALCASCTDYATNTAWTQFANPATFTSAPFNLTVKSDADPGVKPLFWTLGNYRYNDTTPTYYINIKTLGSASISLPVTQWVAGVPFVVSFVLSAAPTTALTYAVETTDPSACPFTFNVSTVSWAATKNGWNPVNATPDASVITTSRICFIRLVDSGGAMPTPQFPAPPAPSNITIRPRLRLSVEDLPSTLSVSSSYTFKIVSRVVSDGTQAFWFNLLTVSASCNGTNITGLAAPFSAALSSQTATMLVGSVTGSCTLRLVANGTALPHFDLDPPTTLTIVSIGQLTATVTPAAAYVGDTVTLTIADSQSKLGSGDNATVTWTWNGDAILTPTGGIVSLSDSNRTARVNFTMLGAGSGNFTFVVSKNAPGLSSTMSTVLLTSINFFQVTVQTPLPTLVSVGTKYAVQFVLTIPQLPATGSVTTTIVSDSTYIAVMPQSVTWTSDGVLEPKTVTVTAVNATPGTTVTNISAVVTSTSTDFVTGNISVGRVDTYRRVVLNATTANGLVYKAPGAKLRVTYALSEVLPADSSITTRIRYTVPDVAGQYTAVTANLIIPAGAISDVVEISPTAVTAVGSPNQLVLDFVNNSNTWSPELDSWYEYDVPPYYFTVAPPFTFSVSCNGTEMYIGPGNEIACNVSVPYIPTNGTVKVTTMDVANFGFVFAPSFFTFTAAERWKIIYIRPPITAPSFNDPTPCIVKFSVIDTSFSYDAPDYPHTIIARKLLVLPLTLLVSENSLLPNTPFNVTASGALYGLTVVPVAPSSGFSFGPSITVPSALESISVMSDQPRVFTLRFAVSGHPFYAANTSDLTIQMETPPPVSMTSYVIDTGYGAETTYLGQVRNLSVSTSEVPVPEGKQLIVTLGYTCNGVLVTDRLFFGQSTLTFEAGEREQFIMVAATGTCANGSVVITSRSGSAQYYYLNGNAHQVNILNRKTAAVKVTNRVYGGFLNTTNLILSISAWPLRDQGVNLAWTNPLPQVLPDVPASGYLEFKQSAAGAALVVSNQRGAASVASVTNVQLTLSLSGAAQSEYFLNQSNVIITVYPVNNVTISTVLVTQPSIFVTENVTIRVSLPEAPINSGGTVPVTPKFDNGSPSAVQITPASAVLSASNMFVDFVFLAKDVTVGNERITFTFASSGTAQNYYPQPAAPSWPVQFKPLGRVTIGTVPSEVFQGVTSTIDVTVSYIPPTGYQNVVVSLASSFTANLIVLPPGSVTWVAGDMSQSLTKQLLVKGNVPTSFVQLTFSLTTKPTIFLSTLNVVTAAVTVKDGRSIIIKPPTFLYLNGKSTTGRVELIKLPTVGTSLDLYYTPNTSAVTVDIQPKPIRFTPSSSLAQDISFTAVAVAPSVTITFTRANDLDMYDTPPPIQIQVRALEKIIVTGMPAFIYVGSSVTITVVITRLPQCANSYLTVRPSFQTTDASFAPSSKTWTSGGDPNQLSSTFVLTAASTTANAVAVTFAIESDCRDIYEASVTSTVTAVKVLPKEQVTVSVPDNATDTTGAFIYQTASVPLTVSLGAPVLPHNGVRVRLAYTGAAGSVVFTPSVVDFPAGSTVYSVIVDMRGVSISSTNAHHRSH